MSASCASACPGKPQHFGPVVLRFTRIRILLHRGGGFIVWMGRGCFPCMANTSFVDFEGNPKPAALTLKNLWRA